MWDHHLVIVFIAITEVVSAILEINVSKYEGLKGKQLDKWQARDHFYVFRFCWCPLDVELRSQHSSTNRNRCQCSQHVKGKRAQDSSPQAVFPKSCDLMPTSRKCLGASFTNDNNKRLFVKVAIGETTVTQPAWQELPLNKLKLTQSLSTIVRVPLRMTYTSTLRAPTMKKKITAMVKPRKNPSEATNKSMKKPNISRANKNTNIKLTSNKLEKKSRIAKAITITSSQKSTDAFSRTSKLTTMDQIRRFLLQQSILAKIDPPQFDIGRLREEVITYHNIYRSKHDSPSLIRDATLDSAAQRWANVMGNRRDCLAHESPRRYGENLFFFGARHFPTPTTMAHMVAHSFYVEGMGYDYKRFYPMTYYKTGHFTQLIWKESRRIGVGVSVVHHDGSKKGPCQPSVPLYMIYVVVKYDPPGNLQTYQAYMNNVRPPIT